MEVINALAPHRQSLWLARSHRRGRHPARPRRLASAAQAAVRLSVHASKSTAVFAPGKAKEDDSMIEPMQQRMLQARMETAEGDTRRRLRIIERQIVSRAERMTVTEPVKRR